MKNFLPELDVRAGMTLAHNKESGIHDTATYTELEKSIKHYAKALSEKELKEKIMECEIKIKDEQDDIATPTIAILITIIAIIATIYNMAVDIWPNIGVALFITLIVMCGRLVLAIRDLYVKKREIKYTRIYHEFKVKALKEILSQISSSDDATIPIQEVTAPEVTTLAAEEVTL